MNRLLLAPLAALLLSARTFAVDETPGTRGPDAQREAFLAMEERMKLTVLESYPAAGVPGTPLYEGIRLGIAWLDETQPAFFADPSWPLKITHGVQRSIAPADQRKAVPAPDTPPRFPLRNDAKAKIAYRTNKTDAAQIDMLRQLAAQLNPQSTPAPAPAMPGARLGIPTAADRVARNTEDTMRANALRTFPSAGVPGTPLYEGIRRGIAWLKETRPDYFKQPGWPELLAIAVQNTLDPLDRITPTVGADQKLEYPPFEDPQALATYRRYKADPELAEPLKRLAAEVDRQATAAAAQRPPSPQ